MITIIGFIIRRKAPVFWAFMSGEKVAPPAVETKNSLPATWQESLSELALI